MSKDPLRVCYFGTYRANYSRNQIMIEGLRRNGVDVVECRATLWQGIEDRVHAASGSWVRPGFVRRVIRTYRELLAAYRNVGAYDLMVLGYPGQLDAFLAHWLTRRRGKPLVMDVFMSIYLIAKERDLVARHPVTGKLIRQLEHWACRLPDQLLLDTEQYVSWFSETYGLGRDRFRLVPTGADDRIFHPVDAPPHADGRFRVLYYGTFIPNHGVDQMVHAAALLRDEADVEFELAGTGPELPRAEALARKLGARNVTFSGWVDKQEIPYKAAAADLCLGAFGQTPQSLRTVQNKIYEGLAMRRPVLTGDSPAVRATLTDRRHVYLVPREDPAALAQAILDLKADPALREQLADEGYKIYRGRFTPTALGAETVRHLREVLGE